MFSESMSTSFHKREEGSGNFYTFFTDDEQNIQQYDAMNLGSLVFRA